MTSSCNATANRSPDFDTTAAWSTRSSRPNCLRSHSPSSTTSDSEPPLRSNWKRCEAPAARIVSAQSDERRRIERNLHDGAQQRLLALAMQLRAAQLRHPSPLPADGPADDAVLDHAISELATAVRELRDLANGLRPPVLADAGLVAALDDLAGRVPMHVELDVAPVKIGESTEDTLWFIACEAVANAVKHADATSLRLTLSTNGGTVTLACHDDGNGLARSNGAGLRGIVDRAETAGGRISIQSVPGTGTTVEAVLPCVS